MVTLILARGGSKRVPNKNILKIGKYPLIAFPIMAAIKLGHDVYVSTDSIKIRNVAKKYGAKVIDRPPHLSTSSSLDIDAFRHFVSETGIIEDILHLRATTPLVNNDELEKIISFFQKNKDVCTSLRTAHESSETAYKFFKKNGIYWNGLFNKSGEYYNKPGQELPKTLEMIGSCTALITNKILGMGLHFDSKIAKILYGATLMDTENRVAHKMTVKDAVIMDYLKRISETKNDEEFYSDLMSCLLNTDDPKILFGRDYKEDWGFGFAVAKVKHAFDKRGNILKKDLVDKALNLAEQNNNDKNLPLTVVKITDYKDDNKTVNKERVYLIFNKNTSKEFIETTSDLLQKHILFEFGRGFNFRIRKSKNFIEFWGTGVQLSRKKTAPVLEPVVKAFNEYFYSPSINLWIKRDFLKKTNLVKKAMKELRRSFVKRLRELRVFWKKE